MRELDILLQEAVKQEVKEFIADNRKLIEETARKMLFLELKGIVRQEIAKIISTLEQENLSVPEEKEEKEKVIPVPVCQSEENQPQTSTSEGRYLYCLAENGEKISFGPAGINGLEVYTVHYQDLCAVVHNCTAEIYQSEDSGQVTSWIMTHQKVIETAWEKLGTILPFGFDTIISGKDADPDENLKNWLKSDYPNLKEKLAHLKDKAEYGVQIFWSVKLIGEKLMETNEELRQLNSEIKAKPKGIAYMYKMKLENLLKKTIEQEAENKSREFYQKIKDITADIKVEKNKKLEGEEQMLMNLSCLLTREESEKLGGQLEQIDAQEGFTVRFTGPWPPYSFV